MSTRIAVNVGDEVFAKGGTEAFGAVRVVRAHELIIDIEGFGDATVPATAVAEVHDRKVVLDVASLPSELRDAIAHAHDAEDR
jgi:preprotein translocase subunit YajC